MNSSTARRVAGVLTVVGVLTMVSTAATVQPAAASAATVQPAAAEQLPFGRSFAITDPTGGARFKGVIEWGPTSMTHPGQAARITNATVSDIAPDDYRAVAWIRYDRITFAESCPSEEVCGWVIASTEHLTPPPPQGSAGGTLPPAGNATPLGDVQPVSWTGDPGDNPVAYDRVLVKVCTEQWRFSPDKVIACSAWS